MWMKCLTDESLSKWDQTDCRGSEFNLQNYWKLSGKKVRNQIGSRGKNLVCEFYITKLS